MRYLCYAACSFGLESCVANELKRLGIEDIDTHDARVYFKADEKEIARANICASAADRIYIVLKEFEAHTFEELFEGVKSINFGDILPKSAKMYVTGDSVHSELKSVSDIQSISKIKEYAFKYTNGPLYVGVIFCKIIRNIRVE